MVHCTGLLANLLNIATLWRQRKLVTYKIFLAMAVADLAVSICLLMAVAVNKTALSFQEIYPLSQPLITFLNCLVNIMTYPPVVMTLRQHKVNNFLKLPDVCVLELASSVISAMHPLFKVSPATPTMFYYWQ